MKSFFLSVFLLIFVIASIFCQNTPSDPKKDSNKVSNDSTLIEQIKKEVDDHIQNKYVFLNFRVDFLSLFVAAVTLMVTIVLAWVGFIALIEKKEITSLKNEAVEKFEVFKKELMPIKENVRLLNEGDSSLDQTLFQVFSNLLSKSIIDKGTYSEIELSIMESSIFSANLQTRQTALLFLRAQGKEESIKALDKIILSDCESLEIRELASKAKESILIRFAISPPHL